MTSKRVNRDTIHVPPEKSFYTPAMRKWLGGYEPVAAAQMMRGYSPAERSAAVSARREEGLAAGEEWARGTIPSLTGDKFVQMGRTMKITKNSRLG